jgi:hypothetical protein
MTECIKLLHNAPGRGNLGFHLGEPAFLIAGW